MFSLLRYSCAQLINNVRHVFNSYDFSFLFTMHEAPLHLKAQSDVYVDSIIDMDVTLVTEDESDTDGGNFEVDSTEITPAKSNTDCFSRGIGPDTEVDSMDIAKAKNVEDWILMTSNMLKSNSDSPYPSLDKTDDSLESLRFNDTIEQVEFMMEKGAQLLNQAKCDSFPISSKPNKNVATISKYDYIKSPIRKYIKFSTLTPLRRNNNNNLHQCVRLKTLSESSIVGLDNDNTEIENAAKQKRRTFPRRAYIDSGQKQIINENVTSQRDGVRMQKLFGELKNSPTVIKHYGRLRSKTYFSKQKENLPIDDSFKEFSMDCGDVSVRVIKSAKQN